MEHNVNSGMTVDFDLRQLSDSILRMFANQCTKGERLSSPLAREVHTGLVNEIARRTRARINGSIAVEGSTTFTLPFMSNAEILDALLNLCQDCAAIEKLRDHIGDPSFSQQLRVAEKFLGAIGDALRTMGKAAAAPAA